MYPEEWSVDGEIRTSINRFKLQLQIFTFFDNFTVIFREIFTKIYRKIRLENKIDSFMSVLRNTVQTWQQVVQIK